MLNRRQFLGAVAASMSLPAATLRGAEAGEWGSPVFDLHFHMRGRTAANLAHLDGAGITKANLLTRVTARDQVSAVEAAAPGRFSWFSSADPSSPENVDALTPSVKAGARGFGEMKYHLATDGPEFRRVYALAADLNVPILIHFQDDSETLDVTGDLHKDRLGQRTQAAEDSDLINAYVAVSSCHAYDDDAEVVRAPRSFVTRST